MAVVETNLTVSDSGEYSMKRETFEPQQEHFWVLQASRWVAPPIEAHELYVSRR